MLFKLAEEVEFTAAISTVCLPSAGEELSSGQIVQTSGWGTLECKCHLSSRKSVLTVFFHKVFSVQFKINTKFNKKDYTLHYMMVLLFAKWNAVFPFTSVPYSTWRNPIGTATIDNERLQQSGVH